MIHGTYLYNLISVTVPSVLVSLGVFSLTPIAGPILPFPFLHIQDLLPLTVVWLAFLELTITAILLDALFPSSFFHSLQLPWIHLLRWDV